MFERRVYITEEEYQTLLKRICNVETQIKSLSLENDDLRDKVLRKIQKKAEPERRFLALHPIRGGQTT